MDDDIRRAVFTMAAQVAEMHQDFVRMTAAIIRLESTVLEHGRRLARVETAIPSSIPPALDEFATETGNYRIPKHFVQRMIEADKTKEAAGMWLGVKGKFNSVGTHLLTIIVTGSVLWVIEQLVRKP